MPAGGALFGGKSFSALPWRPMAYMDEYLAELHAAEVARSESYLRAVKVGLSRFTAWARDAGIAHPDEITRDTVLRYQGYLVLATTEFGRPLSAGYRRQLLKILRGWLLWLRRRRYITGN